MKRAALVLAAVCLLAACDDDDDDDNGVASPTAARATAPEPREGPQNPQPPAVAPADNGAPTLVLKIAPRPATGAAPFVFTANMCLSSDPERNNLNFKYLWGDGNREYHQHNAPCAISHRYTRAGRYRAVFCTDDGWPDHEVCDNVIVTVQ